MWSLSSFIIKSTNWKPPMRVKKLIKFSTHESDSATFFGNWTRSKIHPEIKPPLRQKLGIFFCWFFGIIEGKKNCFWNFLTFKETSPLSAKAKRSSSKKKKSTPLGGSVLDQIDVRKACLDMLVYTSSTSDELSKGCANPRASKELLR